MSDLVKSLEELRKELDKIPDVMLSIVEHHVNRLEWKPISTFPDLDNRPSRLFVVLIGFKANAHFLWQRRIVGLVYIDGGGFRDEDIKYLEKCGDMDLCTGVVTHWLPCDILPPIPRS